MQYIMGMADAGEKNEKGERKTVENYIKNGKRPKNSSF